VREKPEVPGPDVLLALNRSATTARLLSGVVHEINNALQVISGTLELLERRTDLPAAVAPALDRLRNQSAKAAAALADVQLFTRASGRDIGTVNLHEVAQHSAGLRMFAIRRAGLTIRVDAAPGDFYVTGNRGQLQQAVLNLIANAEQALVGTRGGSILMTLEAEDSQVVLRVSDGGAGIARESRERAFDAFVTTREPSEGAGLGLWAARTIATAHGGTLAYEEQPEGASFALRLPRGAR
jgi:signal transduction histidine kinase